MPERNDLSAEAALREVNRAQGTVQQSSRRVAHLYLAMWLAATAFWLLTLLGPPPIRDNATWLLIALIVAGAFYVPRLRVYGRQQLQRSYSVTAAFVGTSVLAALYNMFLHPQEPSPLWAVADVLVALIAAAPLLYRALHAYRAPGER
ncbi:hypothetical protein ABZ897_27365 [Nonomuraea sp. NPDC046802]|uniref:hypothetical protein n=1 Tax=Nonomuraea sp. NPDC046802 TaxID=3154919 RepID=UPI0033E6912D